MFLEILITGLHLEFFNFDVWIFEKLSEGLIARIGNKKNDSQITISERMKNVGLKEISKDETLVYRYKNSFHNQLLTLCMAGSGSFM